MEDWAKRIHARMLEMGKIPADLARACKVKPASVSGWFGQGAKPTKMISGDNLVAAASFLGTTAEFIMTGRQPPPPSHSTGLDTDKLATVLSVVEGAIRDSGKRVPPAFKARMIKRVYDSQHTLTPDSAGAVQDALAGILETIGAE